MAKKQFKPGNMLAPVPAALITCKDSEGRTNMLTLAWVGTICSDPPMLSISIRKERFSHHMVLETGEFVVNLTTEEILEATDYAGVKSGRDVDKWKETGLTPEKASVVDVPLIKESPLNLECRVKQVLELGSHDMFIADIVAVDADEKYLDETGRFRLDRCGLIAYSHGDYQALGKTVGTFGFSVRKDRKTQSVKKSAAKSAANPAAKTAAKNTVSKKTTGRKKTS
ncbi:MAG: flavin reductase family protein [Lachnospiraceae bacterium]|nr:flavin reductase family protein [Lachnospiraceae bacterium]